MSKPLVLIVEDEADIADLIEFHLAREGYQTSVASSGIAALDAVSDEEPALILLDIMLPDLDGLEVCRRLKASSATEQIPIIMVSAKGEESDVVVGLELGADDYVAKPFSPRVLLARTRAVLRRHQAAPAPDGSAIEHLGVRIDPQRHEVRVNGDPISLTLTEHRLLEYLAARPGFVRTRDQIVSAVRGEGTVLSSRAVDVHVASLRRKLGDHSSIIETVRGVGYRLADPDSVVTT